jgi:hypothetical protein
MNVVVEESNHRRLRENIGIHHHECIRLVEMHNKLPPPFSKKVTQSKPDQ